MHATRRVVKIEVVDYLTSKVWLDDGSELVGLTDIAVDLGVMKLALFELKGFMQLADVVAVTPPTDQPVG